MSSEGGGSSWSPRTLAVPLALLAATFLAYGWVLDLDHMGWDAWPLIDSTRLVGPGDFARLFTTEFMGGLFPDGHFYRPLTSLSFALDGLLWGTNPAGFHHTDLLLLAMNALAVYHLARRLPGQMAGNLSGRAALFAAALFLLHPIQVELIPAAPRRADSLCLLFTLLALCRVAGPLVPAATDAIRRRWPLALLVLCAALSKETGLVALPLVTLFVFLRQTGAEARGRGTLSAVAPALVAIAGLLILRVLVLSGMGGYDGGTTVRAALAELPTRLGQYGAMILYPQQLLAAVTPGVVVSVLSIILGCATVLALRSGEREGPTPIPFLLLWMAGTAIISSAAGRISWWYGLQFLPPFVLLIAHLAGRVLGSGHTRRPVDRIGACILSVLVLPGLVASGAWAPYTEWQRGSEATERWLDHAHDALLPAGPGARVTLADLPVGVIPSRSRYAVHSAALLAPYSLVAWLQVHFPGRTFRVAERAVPTLDAGPQGTGALPIRIEITRRLVP